MWRTEFLLFTQYNHSLGLKEDRLGRVFSSERGEVRKKKR
jgi:hypothetical protein